MFEADITGPAGFAKTVCLKRIRSELSNDDEFVAMFQTEARIAAMLHHTNIVSVSDFDRHAGRLFLAMEYVDGSDLKQIISEANRIGLRLPIEFAVYMMDGLLAALDHAHTYHRNGKPQPIIHRDVSPHNVLVSLAGQVKLTDFGIAKSNGVSSATQVGVIKGKVAYVSPEQINGVASPLSDLFSAGLVLYETLTGKRFFHTEDAAAIPQLAYTEFSPVSWLPERLNAYLAVLLAAAPENRFQSAAAARTALKAIGISPISAAETATLVRTGLLLKQQRMDAERRAGQGVPRESMLETNLSESLKEAEALGRKASGAAASMENGGIAGPARPSRIRSLIFVSAAALIAAAVGIGILAKKAPFPPPPVSDPTPTVPASPPPSPPTSPPPDAEPPRVSIPVENAAPASPPKVVRLGDPRPSSAPPSPDDDSVRPPAEDKTATKRGTLDVNVRPWAAVFVDGEAVGTTPVKQLLLKAGRHTVRLQNKPLNFTEEIKILIRAGKPFVIKREIKNNDP